MGKTLYEFVFGSSDLQLRKQPGDNGGDDNAPAISVEGARASNEAFREELLRVSGGGGGVAAVPESRFPLSRAAADLLLSMIRGLCGPVLVRDEDGGEGATASAAVLSFADAEALLLSEYYTDGSRRP